MSVALLLFPDFLLICAGTLLQRRRALDPAFWPGVERLVYYVLFPALLFRSLAHASLAISEAWRLVATGLAFTVVGMALSGLAGPLLRLPRATFASCFQCGFRFNSYVAFAVAGRLGGEAGLAAVSLLVGVLVPVVNIGAVAGLAHGRPAHMAAQLARNPLLLACVAGMAWKATGLALADPIDHLLALLAGAALPLGLLAVGAGLRFGGGHLPWRALAWWTTVKLAAVPACAYAVASSLGLVAAERQAAVLLAAVPTASSAYILAVQMKGEGAPVALLISTGMLVAALTLPAWAALLR